MTNSCSHDTSSGNTAGSKIRTVLQLLYTEINAAEWLFPQRGPQRAIFARWGGRKSHLQWCRHYSGYPRLEGWVFASPAKDGQQPYWPGSLYRPYLEPAAKAAGIPGKIGWHTFRHTFATLLKANGEDIKTVQELLRHANISVTMNVYAQGVIELKRNAQHRIVGMVTGGKDVEAEETA